MRIRDCSSDVCSSDLGVFVGGALGVAGSAPLGAQRLAVEDGENHIGVTGVDRYQHAPPLPLALFPPALSARPASRPRRRPRGACCRPPTAAAGYRWPDRKSVVEGQRVAVSVDLGGLRIIKN